MKSEDEVLKRLRDLKFRYLGRILRKELRPRPQNCVFNSAHSVTDGGKEKVVRLCMLGVERPDWDVDICDTAKQAACCPAFLPVKSRDEIEEEFEARLSDLEWLREHHRDLYTLTWVVNGVEPQYTLWQRFVLSWTAWRSPHDRTLTDREENGNHED